MSLFSKFAGLFSKKKLESEAKADVLHSSATAVVQEGRVAEKDEKGMLLHRGYISHSSPHVKDYKSNFGEKTGYQAIDEVLGRGVALTTYFDTINNDYVANLEDYLFEVILAETYGNTREAALATLAKETSKIFKSDADIAAEKTAKKQYDEQIFSPTD